MTGCLFLVFFLGGVVPLFGLFCCLGASFSRLDCTATPLDSNKVTCAEPAHGLVA